MRETFVDIAPAHDAFPDPTIVTDHMSALTAAIAVNVHRQITEIHTTGFPVDKKDRVAMLDRMAARVMENMIVAMPFSVVSVGSEGEKEKHNGKLGVAMPTVLGRFGGVNGEVWMVNDPVEGTTAAANNMPGAISIVAVTAKGGIMATPDGIHYMDKVFAPPKAVGKVSVDKTPRQNLIAVCDAYGVGPQDVTVVVMNRPRNAQIMQEMRAFGANLKPIEAGDLVPALLSVLPPESHKKGIHMLLGIGGWEEGVIAAAAAKAVGGAAEGRKWAEHLEEQPRLSLNDLVPAKPHESVVIFSAITDDPWFGVHGVGKEDRGHLVQTVKFDAQGMSNGNYYFFPR